MLKKLVTVGTVGVLVVAVWGHLREAFGVRACACEPTCWCKRPGLNFFRWVTPVDWHHIL